MAAATGGQEGQDWRGKGLCSRRGQTALGRRQEQWAVTEPLHAAPQPCSSGRPHTPYNLVVILAGSVGTDSTQVLPRRC